VGVAYEAMKDAVAKMPEGHPNPDTNELLYQVAAGFRDLFLCDGSSFRPHSIRDGAIAEGSGREHTMV